MSSYVRTRIDHLRVLNSEKRVDYNNVACIRANAMKHLPFFFAKGQLKKAFVLFPDPHFKKQKLKWRVVSPLLLSEYAYLMQEGAMFYTITDVLEVHEWMKKCFDEHPLFERVPESELAEDECYKATFVSTEEGHKVARNNGSKYPAVYRRVKGWEIELIIEMDLILLSL